MRVLVVTAMYPSSENPARDAFVKTQVESLQQAGVSTELFLMVGRNPKLKYAQAVPRLRKRLANGSIDLIHAHYSYSGFVARAQWQVPVVVTFHGDDLLGTPSASEKRSLLSRVLAFGGKALAYIVDAAIVQNEEMARLLKGVNVHLIPCEVNLDLFRPVERDLARTSLGLELDKRYVLFASNPAVTGKNFPLARAVADQLSAGDPTIKLVVVYKETQERLALFMNACDALIFPSLQEGSPVVVKQAMACNLPIVATDVGDVRELIAATAGCYVCPPNIPEFAARLAEIFEQRERTAGREHVRHLAAPVVAGKIIQVYEEVLKRHWARRGHHLQAIPR